MLKTIVLICAASVEPSSCSTKTAVDIVRLPPVLGVICGMSAPSSLTELELRDGRYPKIVCERVGAAQ